MSKQWMVIHEPKLKFRLDFNVVWWVIIAESAADAIRKSRLEHPAISGREADPVQYMKALRAEPFHIGKVFYT